MSKRTETSAINKPEVFIVADNILSPLGSTSSQNLEQVKNGISGIKIHNRPKISDVPLAASLFEEDRIILESNAGYTKFEQLLIASVIDALSHTDIDPANAETGLIISTTKGNISLLETAENIKELQQRMSLNTSAQLVAGYFGFTAKPIVISNACISGVMAITAGARLIKSGTYKNVVVCGADVISKFVVLGFQSFQALSTERCSPFDKNRNGLNLGEGAATMILSANAKYKESIKISGGASSNDANHISGPSRTGLELADAISKATTEAGLKPEDISVISAHGTATVYNDDMEANALTLAGLAQTPLTALKAFYGHTLGAAGLIESIMLAKSIEGQVLLPSLGFEMVGTKPLNVIKTLTDSNLTYGLKTASGFGGCNAALLLSKV